MQERSGMDKFNRCCQGVCPGIGATARVRGGQRDHRAKAFAASLHQVDLNLLVALDALAREQKTLKDAQLPRPAIEQELDALRQENAQMRSDGQAAIDAGEKTGVTSAEAKENRDLRRRVKLLEQENEVLRRAAAYLGQASIPKG